MTTAATGLGITLLVLSGCAAVASPDGKSTPSTSLSANGQGQSPTPTESTAPAAPAAPASIVISVSSIQIRDSSRRIVSDHDYFTPAADVVAILSDAIGTEPTVAHYDSHADSPAGTSFDWDGFALRDDEWTAEAPYYSDFHIFSTVATAGGLSVETTNGVSVGDSMSSVSGIHSAHTEFATSGLVSLEWTELPPFPDGYGVDVVPAISVLVVDSDESGAVTRIIAPVANWGG